VLAATRLTALLPEAVAIAGSTALAISILLVNWTRLWVKESREPFKYTYSVGDFVPGPDTEAIGFAPPNQSPIGWLSADMTEKLGERVSRLSLLEETDVPPHEVDEDPAPHVHIEGWYGPRQGESGTWYLEVVPRIRIGGIGAPAKLARTIRFKLLDSRRPAMALTSRRPPPLEAEHYKHLRERVYWSVASEIYAQIREGVEKKVMLLPPGRLRATAYLYEADDYATSNTLDAFEAARSLYRKAQETYDRASRKLSATTWRRAVAKLWTIFERFLNALRLLLAKLVRRFGQRELLSAKAQLGYARMLVAEWNLRILCGSTPKELYEAPPNILGAITRLERLPPDVVGQESALFRAFVTMALAQTELANPVAARVALNNARQIYPSKAPEDAEFLLAEAGIAGDPLRSLRLLARAVELAPTMERARHKRAELLEALWRRRERFEPAVADTLDAEYAEVIAIDPGNVSAWANRGYVGWLLSKPNPDEEAPEPNGRPCWRERAISSLEAGRQYKEVRRDAMVGELNWNLARFQAEEGDFASAYDSYIQAVSALMSEPRMNFLVWSYQNATEALVSRYSAYETRVEELVAEATHGDDERLVRSVLSFVLNDCGGAYYAYHLRTGDAAAFDQAVSHFERAIAANPSFVLPKLNLADLSNGPAFDQTLDPGERAVYLNTALYQVREALDIEPDWVFGRMQIAMLEAQLPSIWDQFFQPPGPSPSPRRTSGFSLFCPIVASSKMGEPGAESTAWGCTSRIWSRTPKSAGPRNSTKFRPPCSCNGPRCLRTRLPGRRSLFA
jgi:tetratricopeptide (TPR) repeat protein